MLNQSCVCLSSPSSIYVPIYLYIYYFYTFLLPSFSPKNSAMAVLVGLFFSSITSSRYPAPPNTTNNTGNISNTICRALWPPLEPKRSKYKWIQIIKWIDYNWCKSILSVCSSQYNNCFRYLSKISLACQSSNLPIEIHTTTPHCASVPDVLWSFSFQPSCWSPS